MEDSNCHHYIFISWKKIPVRHRCQFSVIFWNAILLYGRERWRLSKPWKMLLALSCSVVEDLNAHHFRTWASTLARSRHRLVLSWAVMQISALFLELYGGVGALPSLQEENIEKCASQVARNVQRTFLGPVMYWFWSTNINTDEPFNLNIITPTNIWLLLSVGKVTIVGI